MTQLLIHKLCVSVSFAFVAVSALGMTDTAFETSHLHHNANDTPVLQLKCSILLLTMSCVLWPALSVIKTKLKRKPVSPSSTATITRPSHRYGL